MLKCCLFVIMAARYEREVPVLLNIDLSILVDKYVARRQLKYILKKCIRCWNIAINQVLIERKRIKFTWNTSLQDRFNFGTKEHALVIPEVIQRFFAKAVASN